MPEPESIMPDIEHCIDCDRPPPGCACEDVLRCSCGIPDSACVCAGGSPRMFTAAEWAEVLQRPISAVTETP